MVDRLALPQCSHSRYSNGSPVPNIISRTVTEPVASPPQALHRSAIAKTLPQRSRRPNPAWTLHDTGAISGEIGQITPRNSIRQDVGTSRRGSWSYTPRSFSANWKGE